MERSAFEAGKSGVFVEHPEAAYWSVAEVFRKLPPGRSSLDEVTRRLRTIGAKFVPWADGAPGDNAYRPEWAPGGYWDRLRGTMPAAKLRAAWRSRNTPMAAVPMGHAGGGGANLVEGIKKALGLRRPPSPEAKRVLRRIDVLLQRFDPWQLSPAEGRELTRLLEQQSRNNWYFDADEIYGPGKAPARPKTRRASS